MNTIKNIYITFCAIAIVLLSSSSYASSIITGTIETKKISEKYSLKNLGSLSHKTSTFYTLKFSLDFKGVSNASAANSTATYLKYNKGNISYVIPFRYKTVLSKFKTPSPNQP